MPKRKSEKAEPADPAPFHLDARRVRYMIALSEQHRLQQNSAVRRMLTEVMKLVSDPACIIVDPAEFEDAFETMGAMADVEDAINEANDE